MSLLNIYLIYFRIKIGVTIESIIKWFKNLRVNCWEYALMYFKYSIQIIVQKKFSSFSPGSDTVRY